MPFSSDGRWRGGPQWKALCGGEALPADLAEALLPRVGALWNMYGPTETTVWSTCAQVRPRQGEIVVGRPIANTQVHVLDDDGAPGGVPADGGADAGLELEGEVLGEQHVPPQRDGALQRAGGGRARRAAVGGALRGGGGARRATRQSPRQRRAKPGA